jgi:hypothetical protein
MEECYLYVIYFVGTPLTFTLKNYNFTCCFAWVCDLMSCLVKNKCVRSRCGGAY